MWEDYKHIDEDCLEMNGLRLGTVYIPHRDDNVKSTHDFTTRGNCARGLAMRKLCQSVMP